MRASSRHVVPPGRPRTIRRRRVSLPRDRGGAQQQDHSRDQGGPGVRRVGDQRAGEGAEAEQLQHDLRPGRGFSGPPARTGCALRRARSRWSGCSGLGLAPARPSPGSLDGRRRSAGLRPVALVRLTGVTGELHRLRRRGRRAERRAASRARVGGRRARCAAGASSSMEARSSNTAGRSSGSWARALAQQPVERRGYAGEVVLAAPDPVHDRHRRPLAVRRPAGRREHHGRRPRRARRRRRSRRRRTGSPARGSRACPSSQPVWVRRGSSATRARPKSISTGERPSISTLVGLMSRCSTPTEWTACSASASASAKWSRSAPAIGPSSSTWW